MKTLWKSFWDILAVVFGLFIGYKLLIYSGQHIPIFGYFPIGVIVGLSALKYGAFLIHGVEIFISWIIFKFFKIRTLEDLPF